MQKVKTASDGVKTGFVNINGTPVQIKTNSAGVITELNGVKQATINQNYQSTTNMCQSKQKKNKFV